MDLFDIPFLIKTKRIVKDFSQAKYFVFTKQDITGPKPYDVVGITKDNFLSSILAYIVANVPSIGTETKNTQIITGVTMTLPQAPSFIYVLAVGGVVYYEGLGFTRVGAVITFASALDSEVVYTVYKY